MSLIAVLRLLAFISVAFAAPSIFTNHVVSTEPYPVHLIRWGNPQERFPHGSKEAFHEIIKQHLAHIDPTTLQHSSCAVVFHGNIGAGKSSIIERLLTRKPGLISSGCNHVPGGKTKEVIIYTLDTGHSNPFYVVDTPGFKDQTMEGRQFQGFASVIDQLRTKSIPLLRLYLVLDIGTGDGTGFADDLKLLIDTYGRDIAQTTRFVVNKSDRLAGRGKGFIEGTLIPNLQATFREQFNKDPKIIFTCASYFKVGCIGQLIDDLYDHQDQDCFVRIDQSLVSNIRLMVEADAASMQARLQPISESEYEEQSQALRSKGIDLEKDRAHNHYMLREMQDTLEKKQAILQALCRTNSKAESSGQSSDRCLLYEDQGLPSFDVLFLTYDLIHQSNVYKERLLSQFGGRQMIAKELIDFWKSELPEGISQAKLASDVDKLPSVISAYEQRQRQLEEQISKITSDFDFLTDRRRNAVVLPSHSQ